MEKQQKKNKKIFIWAAAVPILILAAGMGLFWGRFGSGKIRNYTIQMEQYVVEYSEKYPYWDVITVEYPVLSGTGGTKEKAINQLFHDMAMDKVNYWHLFPNGAVKRLQNEEYQIYCSDVRCDITFHSQYLASAVFYETYAPVNPVYYAHKTRRSTNVNLITGEEYGLSDVLQVNDGFMELWCRQASQEYGDVILDDEDTRETFLSWFLGEYEELEGLYMFRPFFYVVDGGDIMVGLAIDPAPVTVLNDLELDSSYGVLFSPEELVPFRTESAFWDLYEQSQETGVVLPCGELRENIWMREDSGIWEEY